MPEFRILGNVDAAHHLSASVPDGIGPGQVEIVLIVPPTDEDDAGAAWMEGIAREWQDELCDPLQDIYTLEDGDPVDGAK